MPMLLDLSPELILLILEDLAPDSQALDNLCLAGNHNLLALVRPYTFREINTTLDDGMNERKRESSNSLAARFGAFFEDTDKASTVRSLNVNLVGFFDDTTPAILMLLKNLGKLSNVTHASICCIKTRLWGPRPGLFVKWAVLALPSLVSLRVDGCLGDADGDDDFLDMKDYPTPPLRHIATRFCSISLTTLWLYCLNLEVVEMAGGDTNDFCLENGRDSVIPAEEYDGDDTSIEFLGSLNLEEKCVPLLNTLKKINVTSTSTIEQCGQLSAIFDEEVPDPPASLKDLCVNLSMDVEEFGKILPAVCGPIIERLAITIPDKSKWSSPELEGLLHDMLTGELSEGYFFARFESLRQLELPFDGLASHIMVLLLELLTHAPALKHLPFDSPKACTMGSLAEVAERYLKAITTLDSISWRHELSFDAVRDDGPCRVVQRPYLLPLWHNWTGIGAWWEWS
ncbi:hypothetical protein C8R47DRAFT_1193959 [Mycena vitilis]|nr:hypothetical protein C8R47DRAFT_1193959 [Mycena vitilis]